MTPPESLVMEFLHLKTFSNYIESRMAVSMLEEEGIRCFTEDETIMTLVPMASGIRLMVHPAQAERALSLLERAEAEYLRTLTCPNCGQQGLHITIRHMKPPSDRRKMPVGGWVSRLTKWLSPSGKKIAERRYTCDHCGNDVDQPPLPAAR
ncbi:MAG: hypothetical protein RJA57_561 [Bacteroidota bacterium]